MVQFGIMMALKQEKKSVEDGHLSTIKYEDLKFCKEKNLVLAVYA